MRWIVTIAVTAILIYLNNASWIRAIPNIELSLLAHRGVHQTYPKEDLGRDECTAIRIDTPQHEYLENTIESIQYAFSLGAEMVEIDIHPTTDSRFAVFHDWEIDCRTNGEGVTREHSLAYLQSLDIGYGYTHDGGKSFPFRGKGVGKMPSLTQVLDTFPTHRFLVNIKSNSPSEADLLSQFLDSRPNENLTRLLVYGGTKPTSRLLSLKPQLKGFTKASVKKCAIEYQLIAWSGYVPESCRDTLFPIPKDYAPYFWGWPRLLVSRMEKVNTEIILVDRTQGHMDGIDNPKEVQTLSKDFRGIIWIDKIERFGSSD